MPDSRPLLAPPPDLPSDLAAALTRQHHPPPSEPRPFRSYPREKQIKLATFPDHKIQERRGISHTHDRKGLNHTHGLEVPPRTQRRRPAEETRGGEGSGDSPPAPRGRIRSGQGGLAGAGFLHIDETPFQVGGSASSHAWVAVGGCMHVTVAGTRGGGRGPDRDSYYGG